jgi:4-methyl-5(b-hydroxyethyl)-thiazole monophosphate biosynthesis
MVAAHACATDRVQGSTIGVLSCGAAGGVAMAKVCVLLAPGFEEIEAVTIIDVLRRAVIETVVLGVEGTVVEGSHGITLQADDTLAARGHEAWDMVVLPGGMPGAAHLRDHAAVQALLQKQHAGGGRLAAICAAPIALSAAGVLRDKRATSYPSFADQLVCAAYLDDAVVVDGTVTTSRGPGTALRFSLGLVAQLADADRAATLAKAMLLDA